MPARLVGRDHRHNAQSAAPPDQATRGDEGMAGSMRDRLRTILNIRKPRKPVKHRGPKPNIGAKIVNEDFRITIQAGMSAELWVWLRSRGWSEVTFRPDRRRYRDVPSIYVTRLIDAKLDDREAVLAAALAHAPERAGSRPSTDTDTDTDAGEEA
jgi:hypothetical protein